MSKPAPKPGMHQTSVETLSDFLGARACIQVLGIQKKRRCAFALLSPLSNESKCHLCLVIFWALYCCARGRWTSVIFVEGDTWTR